MEPFTFNDDARWGRIAHIDGEKWNALVPIMDIPSRFNVDLRRGRIAHIGGDQLNLNIHIPRTPPAAPPSSESIAWKVLSVLCNYIFSTVFYDTLVG